MNPWFPHPGVHPPGAEGRGSGQEGGTAAGSRDLQPAVVQLRALRHVLSIWNRHELPDVSGEDGEVLKVKHTSFKQSLLVWWKEDVSGC